MVERLHDLHSVHVHPFVDQGLARGNSDPECARERHERRPFDAMTTGDTVILRLARAVADTVVRITHTLA